MTVTAKRRARTKSANEPRTKPASERRDDLMNAAQRLFVKKGVIQTTIDDITAGAGLSKGAFYLHFTSKEEVLGALGERFAKKYVEDLQASIDKHANNDWSGKLCAWAKAAVEGLLSNGELVNVLFHSHPLPPEPGKVEVTFFDPLLTLLERGVTARAWSLENPRFTALFISSGLHGVVDDVLLNRRRVDRSGVIQRLQQICLKAVGVS